MANLITAQEFGQLITALNETMNYVHGQNNLVHKSPEGLTLLINDVRVVASMASQVLDNDMVSIAQKISLKATLLKLENEIRLLEQVK